MPAEGHGCPPASGSGGSAPAEGPARPGVDEPAPILDPAEMRDNLKTAVRRGRGRSLSAVPSGTEMRIVRCACRRCGCHVLVRAAITVGGCCGNCGSYDLEPVAPAPARPAEDVAAPRITRVA